MKDEEGLFKKVFGESVGEAWREMGEGEDGTRARKVEAGPEQEGGGGAQF